MAIERGTRLGPYEIVSRIGAGGMGEVWRGRDTRLERAVAIKILPAEFAHDAKFKIRFEREAKAISQLNHPNICTLYDVGENFLVMELLEGESLADRVARGPLSVAEVLKYGVQIAEALGKAHREGIIHRDLKPGNIMLTKSGAKLLDFGLARREMVEIRAESMTVQKPVTEEGTIVGTFQYMAPEQLEGQEADARTDIFALGAVLYEMATGNRAFQGSTKTSLIAAIVTGEPPPISQLQPLAPPALEHVIKKCLAKDADGRWQSAYDIAEELRWTGEIGSASGAIEVPQMRRAAKQWRLAAVSSLVVAAVVITVVMTWRGSHSDRPAVMRFTLPVAGSEHPPVFAVAPNGHEIVYGAGDGEITRLYRRAIDQSESTPIEGTEGAVQPFFSPDGKWIGFFARHKLMKVATSGGQPLAICTATQPRGATWGDDDTIIFCPFFYSGLQRVSATSGSPQKLTTVDPKQAERSHRWPHLLPGSKVVLFSVGYGESWDDAKIVAQRLDTGERKVIINGGYDGRYLPTGHLAYLRGTSLYAVGFDPKRLATRGQPIEIVKDVRNNAAGAGGFAFADNGMLAYFSGTALREGRVPLIVNRHGDPQPMTTLPMENISVPRLSPDSTKLAGEKGSEIWVFDLRRGTSSRLTTGPRSTFPVWSPDGKRVAYASERNGPYNLYWRAADGSDQEQLLARSDVSSGPTDFSPDGKQLLIESVSEPTGIDVVALSLTDRRVNAVVQSENDESSGVFSPDGRWIAYVSDETGRQEVYVRRAFGEGGKYQVSTDGGTQPAWRRNEIFYRRGSGMMAVTVRTEPEFAADTPRLLFEMPFSDFDVTRDGQRFVIIQQKEKSAGPDHLNVVVNWFDEVRARMRAER